MAGCSEATSVNWNEIEEPYSAACAVPARRGVADDGLVRRTTWVTIELPAR